MATVPCAASAKRVSQHVCAAPLRPQGEAAEWLRLLADLVVIHSHCLLQGTWSAQIFCLGPAVRSTPPPLQEPQLCTQQPPMVMLLSLRGCWTLEQILTFR